MAGATIQVNDPKGPKQAIVRDELASKEESSGRVAALRLRVRGTGETRVLS